MMMVGAVREPHVQALYARIVVWDVQAVREPHVR